MGLFGGRECVAGAVSGAVRALPQVLVVRNESNLVSLHQIRQDPLGPFGGRCFQVHDGSLGMGHKVGVGCLVILQCRDLNVMVPALLVPDAHNHSCLFLHALRERGPLLHVWTIFAFH